jgi:uncharacterized membrane protein YoaK (UPF0700 family)
MTGRQPAVTNRSPHLVRLLLSITLVTGLVDAFSYLALGRVFVANMTGNVVFLGFAWAGEPSLSAALSVAALIAFLLGALGGGALAARRGRHRGRHLLTGSVVSLALLLAALAVALAAAQPYAGISRYALVVLLGVAMGVQNATARALGVPDATTTVLTLTLTGLAADTQLARGANPRVPRRLVSVLAMLAGALIGAALVLHVNAVWALAAAVALMAVVGLIGVVLVRGTTAEDWQAAR